MTKANELFYAGAVFVTNRLGMKIDQVAGERNQCRRKIAK